MARRTRQQTVGSSEQVGEPGSGDSGAPIADGTAAGADTVNPAEISGAAGHVDSDTGGGGRKRKYTRRTGAKGPKKNLDVGGLERIIFSAHTVLAALSKTPELALSQVEAKSIADASAAVLAHYDFGMDDKTAAWVNLAMVAGSCYGPRLLAAGIRRNMERRSPKEPAAAPHQQGNGYDPNAPLMVDPQAFMGAPAGHG